MTDRRKFWKVDYTPTKDKPTGEFVMVRCETKEEARQNAISSLIEMGLTDFVIISVSEYKSAK